MANLTWEQSKVAWKAGRWLVAWFGWGVASVVATVTTDTDFIRFFTGLWWFWEFNPRLHRAVAGFYGSLPRCRPEQWRKTNTDGVWISGKHCFHPLTLGQCTVHLKPESRVYFSLSTAKVTESELDNEGVKSGINWRWHFHLSYGHYYFRL